MTLNEFGAVQAVSDILKMGNLPLTLYLLESVWVNKDGIDPISESPDGKAKWDAIAVSTDRGAIEKARHKTDTEWGFLRPNAKKWKSMRVLKITITDEQEKRPEKKPESVSPGQIRLI